MKRIMAALGLVLGLYLIGRAIAEPFVIDLGDPAGPPPRSHPVGVDAASFRPRRAVASAAKRGAIGFVS